MLFLLIITPIVHFLFAKTKFTITRIIIVLLQEIIQTMIWKRIYANRTKWFSYFLILFGTIIPYMLYLDKDIPSGYMATIILIALFLWIELLQYQRKLLFFTFGVSIACLLLYYKGFPTKMCEIFPLMLQAKKEK